MNARLDTVSFRYVSRHAGDTVVFKGLSLDVPSGQCLGILGREGSGKSTLLQMLDGLVMPESGRVLLDGVEMTGDRWGEARMKIGLGFQFPEHQFFAESVQDEFLFGWRGRGVTEAALLRRAKVLLRDAGLDADAVIERSPYTLSMGESRRVALAMLLVHRPRLLLVDEISAGLDAEGTRTVLDILLRASQEGCTIVAVSHDTDFLAEVAERAIVLEGGTVVEDAKAEEVFGDAALLGKYGYLRPQTVEVAEELRRLGASLPRRLYRERDLLDAASAFRRSGA